MQPLTLRDGTFLPKGTHVAFAAADILSDESKIKNPETFDAYRSYRSRNSASPHILGQNDKDHLAFGNGKQACPGRLFAVAEIKTVFARLLLEYDFKYPEGKGRPENLHVNEMVVVNPTAKLMIRKKREA
jgi:cytochrome P450